MRAFALIFFVAALPASAGAEGQKGVEIDAPLADFYPDRPSPSLLGGGGGGGWTVLPPPPIGLFPEPSIPSPLPAPAPTAPDQQRGGTTEVTDF